MRRELLERTAVAETRSRAEVSGTWRSFSRGASLAPPHHPGVNRCSACFAARWNSSRRSWGRGSARSTPTSRISAATGRRSPWFGRRGSSRILLATPRIQRANEEGFFKLIENAAPDGVMIRNLGAIGHFRNTDLVTVGDFSLNVANPLTAQFFKGHGLDRVTISYDLNIGQVLDLLRRPRRNGSSSRSTSTCRCFTWSTASLRRSCRRKRSHRLRSSLRGTPGPSA